MAYTASIVLLILAVVNGICVSYYTPEKIYERNIHKTVEIKVSSDNETWGYATGCFIDGDGRILTNRHVVYNQTSGINYSYVYVRLASSTEFVPAQIEKISGSYDLAIIKISQKSDYTALCLNYKIV